jgi:hypothetical protein
MPMPRAGLMPANAARPRAAGCVRYTERLAEAGIEPSVGSVGDSYDKPSPKPSTAGSRLKWSIGAVPGAMLKP